MKINSPYFGEFEVTEDKIITFDQGILGFEESKRYIMMNNYDTEQPVPFKWLQSVDDENLAFVIVYPFLIKGDYDFELEDEIVDELGIHNEDEVAVYNIVHIPEEFENTTVNLKAPIIINSSNMHAKQVVLDDERYTVKYYAIKEFKNMIETMKRHQEK